MRVDAQEPPWRVIRAFEQVNGGSLVHLHNVSGGMLGGDRLSLKIGVGSGASALVTTSGATRIYRNREGSPASEQHVQIDVGENALLEYLPDPLIPFAGSRHLQRTSVLLGAGATLFWWETLAPGRQAMGETFAFDSLRIETSVRSARPPAAHRQLRTRAAKPSPHFLSTARLLFARVEFLCVPRRRAGVPMERTRGETQRILWRAIKPRRYHMGIECTCSRRYCRAGTERFGSRNTRHSCRALENRQKVADRRRGRFLPERFTSAHAPHSSRAGTAADLCRRRCRAQAARARPATELSRKRSPSSRRISWNGLAMAKPSPKL